MLSSPVTLPKLRPGAALFTVSVTVVESPLTLPTALVALALITWAPSDQATPGTKDQMPSALAVASPSRVDPSYTRTTAPAAEVPAMVGVALPTVPAAVVIVGTATLSASTTSVKGVESVLEPTARAFKEYVPLVSAVEAPSVYDQKPCELATMALAFCLALPRYRSTVPRAAAVPLMVGVVSLVAPSAGRPLSLLSLLLVSLPIPRMTGVSLAPATMVKLPEAVDTDPILPAASTTTATRL